MPSPGGLQKLAQLALVFGCLGVCLVSFLEYKDYLFRPSPTIGHLLVRARNIFLQNNAHTPPNLGEEEEEEEKTVLGESPILGHNLSDFLFYNAIPKTGSQTMEALFRNLAKRNGYKFMKTFKWENRRYSLKKQKSRCRRNQEYYKRLQIKHERFNALAIGKHLYLVDCTQFNYSNPIYFTTIREPLQRFLSRYAYRRSKPGGFWQHTLIEPSSKVPGETKAIWMKKRLDDCILRGDNECAFKNGTIVDMPIAYFCGHHPKCAVLGSSMALRLAKVNIERWFPVVWVMEESLLSFQVMEAKLPLYFSGATELSDRAEEKIKNKTPDMVKQAILKTLTAEAREVLASRFAVEYDLYNYLRQRIHRQAKELGISQKMPFITSR